MSSQRSIAAVAQELARLSTAIADALEAKDLEAAEGLAGERGRRLDEALRLRATGQLDGAGSDLGTVARIIDDAGRRGEAALQATIARTHAELTGLTTGSRAMRAYLGREPLAPGWVDVRD